MTWLGLAILVFSLGYAVIAGRLLERFRLDVTPGYRMDIRQMPTISPKHGLPVVPRSAEGGPARSRPALAA